MVPESRHIARQIMMADIGRNDPQLYQHLADPALPLPEPQGNPHFIGLERVIHLGVLGGEDVYPCPALGQILQPVYPLVQEDGKIAGNANAGDWDQSFGIIALSIGRPPYQIKPCFFASSIN